MAFINILYNLWPNGDEKVKGLRDGIAASAPAVFAKYGIDTPLLVAHVMAQISHECGAGHDVVENLNYTAQRMMQVWPSRFPTLDSAKPYAGNPRALANKVYNGRMGNRAGPDSDDGWNYRGRGGSQTTGLGKPKKEGGGGYTELSETTGLDLVNHPDLVNDPIHFLECGVADFIQCGCLPYAKNDDLLNVTKRLNGGTIGLSERAGWLRQWKAALGSGPIDFTVPAAASQPASIPEPPPIVLPPPGQPGTTALAPTFWGRFSDMFKPKVN